MVLQPRICRNKYGLGSFHFARRYFGNRCFFLFLLLLRCFSSEGWPPKRMLGLLPNGLSHSEIFGSSLVCKSPKLIAAYHVFLRLQEPRHPPYALIYFLLSSSKCLFHLDEAYLISLNMSMNFDRTKFRSGWRIRESNPWPPACKAGALANWANPPEFNWVVPCGLEPQTPTLSV